jgi:hypothetical protein
MDMGIKDDPTSKFTRLFVPSDHVRDQLVSALGGQSFGESALDTEFERHEIQKDIKLTIQKKINKEKENNSTAERFFEL